MDNQTVINLLTDYRSYKFALSNLGVADFSDDRYLKRGVYDERVPYRLSNYDYG